MVNRLPAVGVFPIPPGTWGDFFVPQSPDPISGFPDPGPIPLPEDFPCPQIVVGAQAQGIQIDDVLSCGAQGAGTFIVELKQDECCGYALDLSLAIPCPILPQEVQAVTSIVDVGEAAAGSTLGTIALLGAGFIRRRITGGI